LDGVYAAGGYMARTFEIWNAAFEQGIFTK